MRFKFLLLTLLLCHCNQDSEPKVDQIIEKSILSHGVNQFKNIHLTFDFRDYSYSLKKDKTKTVYSRSTQRENTIIKDVLINSKVLKRTINTVPEILSDSLKKMYSESLNSVMYFFQLPHVLNDNAVIKKYLGSTSIKGEPYHCVKITFSEDDGGIDFQDQFHYWIHQSKFTIDYFAYNYQSSGGGTRFREAINRRMINGILFQDYNNFKPKQRFITLDSLPHLFENGQLLKVSIIENKNITIHQ